MFMSTFGDAGFIYYGNIRYILFFFEIWDKPKWENPLFGVTDFTVGFADPMFPIRCATVVELATSTGNGRFLRKTAA